MQQYILRRLLMMPLLLLGVVTVAFFLSHVTKGDPLSSVVSERQMNNKVVVEAARKRWGLDRSLPDQYRIYLGNLVTGDLGTSFRTKRGVGEDIADRLPATLELVVAAMIVGTGCGIGLGVLAAHKRNEAADHGARFFALIGSSIPVFWSGLILLYLFSVQLGWLPGAGRLDARTAAPPFVTGMFTVDALIAGDLQTFLQALGHLILPAFVLGWAVMGIISRLVRASMLDVLNQDYVLTARAKGAAELRVLLHHALRNALIPTLTIIGYSFAYLITGAVLTEAIFSWPGIGSYAVESARALDYPAIVGVTIIGALAFLLANLVTDVAYALANPKIKLG
ncbi:peptide/nickel transport system permease protein [Tistlia consotensis]|uniref:Peptide/nickel transport system permease protein n=1 Tax=Tistlia consotensis USBA 355 TaxID=560819 RepID=A0A1Y6BRB7_9PROT|nr:ABC transporter permease [Tistlia consotensis]SMF16920.1 peptide/nickel transport system permease protein [Tistlia consotensis USBA 355]SNR40827.1 peptide/nickel transport system permease protein [Tistlia consotensis]